MSSTPDPKQMNNEHRIIFVLPKIKFATIDAYFDEMRHHTALKVKFVFLIFLHIAGISEEGRFPSDTLQVALKLPFQGLSTGMRDWRSVGSCLVHLNPSPSFPASALFYDDGRIPVESEVLHIV